MSAYNSYGERFKKQQQRQSSQERPQQQQQQQQLTTNQDTYIKNLENQVERLQGIIYEQNKNDEKCNMLQFQMQEHDEKFDNITRLIKLLQQFAESQEDENKTLKQTIKAIYQQQQKQLNIQQNLDHNSQSIMGEYTQNLQDKQQNIQQDFQELQEQYTEFENNCKENMEKFEQQTQQGIVQLQEDVAKDVKQMEQSIIEKEEQDKQAMESKISEQFDQFRIEINKKIDIVMQEVRESALKEDVNENQRKIFKINKSLNQVKDRLDGKQPRSLQKLNSPSQNSIRQQQNSSKKIRISSSSTTKNNNNKSREISMNSSASSLVNKSMSRSKSPRGSLKPVKNNNGNNIRGSVKLDTIGEKFEQKRGSSKKRTSILKNSGKAKGEYQIQFEIQSLNEQIEDIVKKQKKQNSKFLKIKDFESYMQEVNLGNNTVRRGTVLSKKKSVKVSPKSTKQQQNVQQIQQINSQNQSSQQQFGSNIIVSDQKILSDQQLQPKNSLQQQNYLDYSGKKSEKQFKNEVLEEAMGSFGPNSHQNFFDQNQSNKENNNHFSSQQQKKDPIIYTKKGKQPKKSQSLQGKQQQQFQQLQQEQELRNNYQNYLKNYSDVPTQSNKSQNKAKNNSKVPRSPQNERTLPTSSSRTVIRTKKSQDNFYRNIHNADTVQSHYDDIPFYSSPHNQQQRGRNKNNNKGKKLCKNNIDMIMSSLERSRSKSHKSCETCRNLSAQTMQELKQDYYKIKQSPKNNKQKKLSHKLKEQIQDYTNKKSSKNMSRSVSAKQQQQQQKLIIQQQRSPKPVSKQQIDLNSLLLKNQKQLQRNSRSTTPKQQKTLKKQQKSSNKLQQDRKEKEEKIKQLLKKRRETNSNNAQQQQNNPFSPSYIDINQKRASKLKV